MIYLTLVKFKFQDPKLPVPSEGVPCSPARRKEALALGPRSEAALLSWARPVLGPRAGLLLPAVPLLQQLARVDLGTS